MKPLQYSFMRGAHRLRCVPMLLDLSLGPKRLSLGSKLLALALLVAAWALPTPLLGQAIPDVRCTLEDLPVKAVVAWQFPQTQGSVQVVVLRDPAGEQQARFDLTHGASLISLLYNGHETLFGQTAGASVSLFSSRQSADPELKQTSKYWAAYSPDQGGSSMGIPAITTGVACDGVKSMRAFAMMQDRGSDNSFLPNALLGVEAGKISDNMPAGYATPYSIETDARWIANPGGSPKYYLKLTQTVVNTSSEPSGPMEWYLNLAAPWNFDHQTSFPEACTAKAPCSGAGTHAIAAGRYTDDQLTNGVGMVVPTADWHTSRAYIQPNAEYVVLLYNAVWAAPRRTFAAVLGHSLGAESAHRFSWFVCVGPWKQTQQFAQQQPAAKTTVDAEEAMLPAYPVKKQAVSIACQTTEFKPQPNQTDRAIVLHDPAGEQTAIFDTTQGGALVSLKYRGAEHIWGYNGGGLLQMAFHNGMKNGAWDGDYNPTQAGDGSANSPVTGISCDGDRSTDILTTMLDFNHNNGFYSKALAAVWDGRVNDMVPLSYSSPYLLETKTRWVPNPAGEPKYYLQLQERLVHVADEKIGQFSFDFAAYIPWEFGVRAVDPEKCPCSPQQSSFVAGGWYLDDSREEGLAVAMPTSNFPNAPSDGGFNSDYMWRNRNFHLGSHEALDGIAAKEFSWYVMAGSWNSAKAFAHSLK